MKKRNLAITAFVLCATLVMAIGFAALSGTLNITGTAYFHGTSVTSSEINSALKFTEVSNLSNCTATIANNHSATLDVTFHDTEGKVGAVFTATATYTIAYTSDDVAAALPTVEFSIPNPTLSSASGSTTGWHIDTDWDEVKTLAFNGTITITVTVTYTNQDPVETGTVSATIAVPMPFATIA